MQTAPAKRRIAATRGPGRLIDSGTRFRVREGSVLFDGTAQVDSVWGGRRFLKEWTTMALRSRIEPIKKFARTLRAHEPQLLNWFRAQGVFAAGATGGLNNKARIATRKAYGFRNYAHVRIALYQRLGNLPEPPWLTHKFF